MQSTWSQITFCLRTIFDRLLQNAPVPSWEKFLHLFYFFPIVFFLPIFFFERFWFFFFLRAYWQYLVVTAKQLRAKLTLKVRVAASQCRGVDRGVNQVKVTSPNEQKKKILYRYMCTHIHSYIEIGVYIYNVFVGGRVLRGWQGLFACLEWLGSETLQRDQLRDPDMDAG